LKKQLVIINFTNDDCSVSGKYRIDYLGKEIKVTAIGLPTNLDLDYDVTIENVELNVADEYDTNLTVYCNIYWDSASKCYYLHNDAENSAELVDYQVGQFFQELAESNGFQLTKYTTPFLAKVDIDYDERHNPENLTEACRKALETARSMGFKALADVEKNGCDRQRNVISKIFEEESA